MTKLVPFEMTDTVIQKMRETRCIPARLFNKEGQTIVFPKQDNEGHELSKLLRFNSKDLFYNPDDAEILGVVPAQPAETLPPLPQQEGLSNTRLISKTMAHDTVRIANTLMQELKVTSLTEKSSLMTRTHLHNLFSSFVEQPDAMTGVVNVLEAISGSNALPAQEMAVKRTIVAMAMKTRGLTSFVGRDMAAVKNSVNDLMMSAMLCDVGFLRMNTPKGPQLSVEDRTYIKTHPLLSYLLIANEDSLSTQVKLNVLNHHRPLIDPSLPNNNYPLVPWLKERLENLLEKKQTEGDKQTLIRDTQTILGRLERSRHYEEDLDILAISSEFASLTTPTDWREAYPARRAVQMIINNSFFTHSDRIMRDFLDNSAVSLCQNQKILDEGQFVVVQSLSAEKKLIWEAGQITRANRWQSRPGFRRVATVAPQIHKDPKLKIHSFDPESIRRDPRAVHIELENDQNRRIVYSIDEEFDRDLWKAVQGKAG